MSSMCLHWGCVKSKMIAAVMYKLVLHITHSWTIMNNFYEPKQQHLDNIEDPFEEEATWTVRTPLMKESLSKDFLIVPLVVA